MVQPDLETVHDESICLENNNDKGGGGYAVLQHKDLIHTFELMLEGQGHVYICLKLSNFRKKKSLHHFTFTLIIINNSLKYKYQYLSYDFIQF